MALVLANVPDEGAFEPLPGDDMLLGVIAAANQGAANFYRFRPETRDSSSASPAPCGTLAGPALPSGLSSVPTTRPMER